jgi:hypothetical protein
MIETSNTFSSSSDDAVSESSIVNPLEGFLDDT